MSEYIFEDRAIDQWRDVLSQFGIRIATDDIIFILLHATDATRTSYDQCARAITQLEREECARYSDQIGSMWTEHKIYMQGLDSQMKAVRQQCNNNLQVIRDRFQVASFAAYDDRQYNDALRARTDAIAENTAELNQCTTIYNNKKAEHLRSHREALGEAARQHNRRLAVIDDMRNALDRMYHFDFVIPADPEEGNDDADDKALAAAVKTIEQHINNI